MFLQKRQRWLRRQEAKGLEVVKEKNVMIIVKRKRILWVVLNLLMSME